MRLADVFMPNEAEIQRLTGTDALGPALAVATAWGTPLVVTRGAAGAVIASPDGITEVADGVRQVTVRDLTGAGDAFAGAMIAALVRGVPLTDAVVAANAAGSEAVARLGAVGEVDVSGVAAVGRGGETSASCRGGGRRMWAGPNAGGRPFRLPGRRGSGKAERETGQ